MKFLKKNWKAFVALLLLIAAAWVHFGIYRPAKTEHERKVNELNTMITALQTTIAENLRYVDVQPELESAGEALDASRLTLYEKFPAELKEEDQIMYILYLEELFGNEIRFDFGTRTPVCQLSDGSMLVRLTMTINYETTYDGFKDMIDYLAADSRITSIETASINYSQEQDLAFGSLTLSRYMIYSGDLEYEAPEVAVPEVGKPNIYG